MLATCRRPQAKLWKSQVLRPGNTRNQATPSKNDVFLHLFCHYFVSNWQDKRLIFSRGGAETDGGEGLKMQEMSVGEEQNPSICRTPLFEHPHIHTQFSNPIL